MNCGRKGEKSENIKRMYSNMYIYIVSKTNRNCSRIYVPRPRFQSSTTQTSNVPGERSKALQSKYRNTKSRVYKGRVHVRTASNPSSAYKVTIVKENTWKRSESSTYMYLRQLSPLHCIILCATSRWRMTY